MTRPFYVTTPIFYVNSVPHIGHAYATLAADALARFHRLDGRDVRFLTGTDEHGQKVMRSAEAAGQTPLAFATRVSARFRELGALMDFTPDDFIRTTEPRHARAAQALWRRLEEAGDLYLGGYAGWYATRDEAYYDEADLSIGPDGKRRAPTGAEVEWVEEQTWFFRLSAYQDRLLAHYEAHPDFVQPAARRNEVLGFLRQGLQDLSISRTTFDWGIPVPGAPGHVMYVWIDALTNYITALGYPDLHGDLERFWPESLHIIGKDILRFHAVYWPAFLMSAGLAPPKRIFVTGLLINQGQKMSKSLGNVVSPESLVAAYGRDALRYFLLREVPFGQDGDWNETQLALRINADLANDLGNLCQRVLSFVAKNAGAAVPEPGPPTDADRALLEQAAGLVGPVRAAFEAVAFHKALEAIWAVIGEANRYVDAQAPWSLRKSDPARMATVLWVLLQVLRPVAILSQPVIPGAAARILDQLAVPPGARTLAALAEAGPAPLTPLPPPEGVFPRVAVPGAAEGANPYARNL